MSEKKPRRCFVIGPIGKPGSPERKHADMLLNAVIREALEGSDPSYEIVRSDKVAEPGMINDRVIHDILNADLVVADLTFLNANAFYELGIRHAAEKAVINFAQVGTELPFDTFGYRAIMEDITSWDGIERARQQIREQAKATEAEGYRVSNPITRPMPALGCARVLIRRKRCSPRSSRPCHAQSDMASKIISRTWTL